MHLGRPIAILFAARSTQHAARSTKGELQMQQIITFMAVVAGLVFSLAVALVVEELIFGQVFRIFFTPQLVRIKSGSQR
jgi:hypothetical protein